jgi:hypothetical protein
VGRIVRFLVIAVLLAALALLARHFLFGPPSPADTPAQPATLLGDSEWSAEVQENVDRFQNKIDASYQGSLDVVEPTPGAE